MQDNHQQQVVVSVGGNKGRCLHKQTKKLHLEIVAFEGLGGSSYLLHHL